MKPPICLLSLLLLLAAVPTAYAGSTTLTTYYPAPFGNYNTIRLTPDQSVACDQKNNGTLFIDSNGNLQVCGSAGSPVAVGNWAIVNGLLSPSPDTHNLSTTHSVSIGTANNPRATLDVNGSVAIGAWGGFTSTPTSFGSLGLSVRPKGGFYGILFGPGPDNANVMYDAWGNGGVYYENLGLWATYYSPGTRHLMINTSGDLGATLGVNGTGYFSGNVGIKTTTPDGPLHINNIGWLDQTPSADSPVFPVMGAGYGLVLDGQYNNGQYRTRFVKIDRSGNLPLYVQQSLGNANVYTNIARFGGHSQQGGTNVFEVFGNTAIDGKLTAFTPTDADPDNTVTTVGYVKTKAGECFNRFSNDKNSLSCPPGYTKNPLGANNSDRFKTDPSTTVYSMVCCTN